MSDAVQNTTTNPLTAPVALGANRPFQLPASSEAALVEVADYYRGIDPAELRAYLSGCDHQVAAYDATVTRDPLDEENGWMAEDEF